MPSHRLHDVWALRYGIPLHISMQVNALIDHGPIHDLGETKRARLDMGMISIPLGPDVTVVELSEELRRRFSYSDYPYAVRAALLHHFLDKIERQIGELGEEEARKSPELVVERAYEKMIEHSLDALSPEELESIHSFLREHAGEVVSEVIADMKHRGRTIESKGPTPLMTLFRKYIERHGYGTLIWIHPMTRPLPLAAAVRKVHTSLVKGEEVCIQFGYNYDPYHPVTQPYCFKDINELIRFLET